MEFIHKLEEIGTKFEMKAVISAIGQLPKSQWSRQELRNNKYWDKS